MEDEAKLPFVGILVEMVDAICVEEGGAALDAVDLVALAQQKLGEVSTVLAGYARYQGPAFSRGCHLAPSSGHCCGISRRMD
jgi:hypothetical protein